MPRAVLKNGVILPLDPLPADWADGQQLRVERADEAGEASLDTNGVDPVFDELDRLCADSRPEEEEALQRALGDAKQIAKEQMRRQRHCWALGKEHY